MGTANLTARVVRVLCIAVLLFSTAQLSAQVQRTEFEGSYISNATTFAIAKSRIAFICSDWEGIYLSTYDSTSGLIWEKDYTVPQERSRRDRFVASADGKDIWALSYYDSKLSDQLDVTIIDAINGDSRTKKCTLPDDDFGIVYSTWANSKYFFVMTTDYELHEKEIEEKPGLKVYRFDKATLEMTELSHDMKRPTKFFDVFWEVVRVEDEFYEAYVTTMAGNMIGLSLSRFDNNGKQIWVKSEEFMIKEPDHFTRQIHGYCTPGPGIGGSNHSYQWHSSGENTYISLIYPMASVQLAYCAKTNAYYACGIIGPGEQKRAATVYDGFFLAKFDSEFKVDKYKEFIDLPVFEGDKNFEIHATADMRYLHCYFDPAGNPVVYFGADNTYMIMIDQSDLALTKAIEIEQEYYGITGGVLNAGSNWIVSDEEVEGELSRYNNFDVLISGNWQYVFKQNYNSGDVVIMTKKVK